MMNELSSGEQLEVLDAYCMPRGVGELFDLSATPPLIERFGFEGPAPVSRGFMISNECTGCGICSKLCPLHCIVEGNPYVIESHCIECGRCYEHCPVNAIQLSRLFRYEEN
jgi:ferredoxin